MKINRIEIKLTDSQCHALHQATSEHYHFGIIAQPLIAKGTMRVLIFDEEAFGKVQDFFNDFVPQELRKN